jgi:hypothetical protein
VDPKKATHLDETRREVSCGGQLRHHAHQGFLARNNLERTLVVG